MFRWFPGLCVFLFLICQGDFSHASVKAEAIVDDKVITSLDVDSRGKANYFFYRTSYAEGNRGEVLQSLIDEAVLEIEAKGLGITVEKEELEQETERLLSALGVCAGQSLELCAEENGLDLKTIQAHLRSRVIWSKILAAKVVPFLSVTNDEVDNFIAETKSNGLETVLDMEQVFVPLRAGSVLDLVVGELQKGVGLDKIAERYREHGVYVDHTVGASLAMFSQDIKKVLRQAEVGEIVGPIKIDRGYLLLKLFSKVRVRKSFMNSVASMKQLSVPAKEAKGVAAVMDGVKGGGCLSFEDAAKRVGFESVDLEVLVKDLSSKLQSMLEHAKFGEVLRSEGSDGTDKVSFVVLCSLKDSDEVRPEEVARIKQMVYTDKIVNASSRLMGAMKARHFIKKL